MVTRRRTLKGLLRILADSCTNGLRTKGGGFGLRPSEESTPRCKGSSSFPPECLPRTGVHAGAGVGLLAGACDSITLGGSRDSCARTCAQRAQREAAKKSKM